MGDRRAFRALVLLLVLAFVAVVVAFALTPRTSPSATAAPSPTRAAPSEPAGAPEPTAGATAANSPGAAPLADLLARLRVAGEDRSGYRRSLFEHWIDADEDGCDTRREVLIAESLAPVAVSGACDLSGGRWRSLYDGVTSTDPSTFDVDHVVPLAEAWDSGAWAWSPERRRRFANDLEADWALIAVSAPSNRSKGDRDPAEWRPPLPAVQCAYAEMWIAVKVRWQLSVDVAEQAVLASLISGCQARLTVPMAP